MEYVALASVIAGGVLQADQQQRVGELQLAEAELAANAAGDEAREEEIQRKEALQRALSSQIARVGAAGGKFSEGSPARIAQLDIDDARRDTLVSKGNTESRQRVLRSRGRAAKSAGDTAAVISLLDTAQKAIAVS